MEREMFFGSATGCKDLMMFCSKITKVIRSLLSIGGEVDEDRRDIINRIKDMVPELAIKEDGIKRSVAFRNTTDKKLPNCDFFPGTIVVWNDEIISPLHKARKHCGEGPFEVYREECQILTVSNKSPKVKLGNNHMVLISLQNQSITIAHSGFFIEAAKAMEKIIS